MKKERKTIHLSQIGGWIALIVFGIAVNFAGLQINNAFNLPTYLDSIGTIASSVIGGYLPGVLVGFFTNTLSSLVYDRINIYYAVLNVLLAVITTALSTRGFLNKFWKAAVMALIIALINGFIGGLISYLINGYLGVEPFIPFIIGETKIELIDKSITVLIVYLFTKLQKKFLQKNSPSWQKR